MIAMAGIGKLSVDDVSRSDRSAEEIQGKALTLVFTLPNGTVVEKKGGGNMTVAYLKTQIASEHKIEYDHQVSLLHPFPLCLVSSSMSLFDGRV
jgi:hypothetical protein